MISKTVTALAKALTVKRMAQSSQDAGWLISTLTSVKKQAFYELIIRDYREKSV